MGGGWEVVVELSMLFNMAKIVNLLLIFEPDANNEPEHIIAICYTEISMHIKHFMNIKFIEHNYQSYMYYLTKISYAIL